MSRKKILLFFRILFKVVGSSIVWIFLTFIPAGLQIYEFLGGDITMLKQLPEWVWFAPLGIYICYSLWQTVYEWLIVPQKIKFSEMQKIHRDLLQSPLKGYKLSGGIDITIPENWNIEDCYVTLEKAVPVYYKDHILIDADEANLVSNFLEPEFKMLLWRSPFASNDCKINIGENGNTESILIGRTVKLLMEGGFERKDFEFCLCSNTDPMRFEPKKLGLYLISFILHWNRNGIKREKNFDGYIYSEITDNMSRITVREGDYTEDPSIPRPILKAKKENEYQEKKGEQKKKSSQKKMS